MFFPDGSGRGEQLNGADSGLEKILADFQSTPSCNYDDQILPPDSFMTSSGAPCPSRFCSVRIIEGFLLSIIEQSPSGTSFKHSMQSMQHALQHLPPNTLYMFGGMQDMEQACRPPLATSC